MSDNKCRCKDCPNRHVTLDYNCHDHCEQYLSYKKANEARNEREQFKSFMAGLMKHDRKSRR